MVEEHSPIESYGTFAVPLFSGAVEYLLAGIYLASRLVCQEYFKPSEP